MHSSIFFNCRKEFYPLKRKKNRDENLQVSIIQLSKVKVELSIIYDNDEFS